jgi:glycosyltransferase involved in cell wall biosynthesis
MKKILFMLSSMNIGGVEKSFLSLLSSLSRERYEITLLLLEKKGDLLDLVPEWVTVEEANWFKKVKPIIMNPPQLTVKEYLKNKELHRLSYFVTTYMISKYLNKRSLYYKNVMKDVPINNQSYDFAIAYQGPTDIIDFYIANKVNARKKISWVHFDITQHKINREYYYHLYKQFNQIYIVSKEAEERFSKVFPKLSDKTLVVPNIVPNELIKLASKIPIELDREYKGLKIVTVGRLSPEKGQDIAVKVLYKLLNDGYQVRWYCIGEGKFRGKLEKVIKEYNLSNDFILLGAVKNPYPFIAQSDIYVQPSRHEGFCITLAEAKILMKPIVSTNFAGASEQLIDGYTGLISNVSETELYEKVSLLIKEPEKRYLLSKNLSDNNNTKQVMVDFLSS